MRWAIGTAMVAFSGVSTGMATQPAVARPDAIETVDRLVDPARKVRMTYPVFLRDRGGTQVLNGHAPDRDRAPRTLSEPTPLYLVHGRTGDRRMTCDTTETG